MLPKRGDRVTLHTRDGEYTVAACFPPMLGILSDAWPLGASQSVALAELSSINGHPVEFDPAEQPQKKHRSRRRAA